MPTVGIKIDRRGLLGMSLAALTGLTGVGSLAEAASPNDDDPVAFVQSLGQQAIALLADENLSPVDRKRVFRELLIDRFDMPSIGRLVMGRYWRRTTEAQGTSSARCSKASSLPPTAVVSMPMPASS